MSAPTLRAIPKISTAEPSAGSTGRSSARASSPARSPAAGPTESGTAAARTATSTRSVASATPHVPTVSASTTDTSEVRAGAEDQQPGDLALAAARDQVLRQHPDRLVDEQDEREQREDGRRLRVPVPDPGVDQVRRDHEQRQREHERGRGAAAQARQQQPALPLLLARSLVLGESRVEQRGHDAGQAEHELEEPRGDRVERRLPRRRARSRRRRRRWRRPPCWRRGRGSCSS